MTVQTFIPNGAKAASENTVTQPTHTTDVSIKKLYIETQGCQMNEYDSHRMADLLGDSHGYVLTTNPNEADILLMNTCSIREKAQEKVFSELGRWRKLKDKNPDLVIGVGGCVASQAFVSIMEGCSKYCSFCVVPYTRGEEVSRPLDDVLA